MNREYQVSFLERKQRTPHAVSYRFSKPTELSFTAGQYMIVDLGNGLMHPLSLSDCPEKKYLEFTKRMTGSPYCLALEDLKQGTSITIKGPMGKFSHAGGSGPLVFLAGGIGITPIRSILKHIERSGSEHRKIILIYGNQDETDIAFGSELEELNLRQFTLIHVLIDPKSGWSGDTGFISEAIITREVPDPKSATFLVSGPPIMVETMSKTLQVLQVNKNSIRTDVFLGY